jgi:hypothetical protein
MAEIVKLKRKPRPLQKTYRPDAPYVANRQDQEDGSITYEIYDERPDTYRFICGVSDDCGQNPYAKHDAEQIASGLNLLVQYGMELLPSVRNPDDI